MRVMVLVLAVLGPVCALALSEPEWTIGLGSLQSSMLDPAGALLATCSESALHLWHINGSLASTFYADGVPLAGFSWSPHGSMIALFDCLGRLKVLKVPELTALWSISHTYTLYTTAGPQEGVKPWPSDWSPDGSMIVLGWCDGRGYIFNLTDRAYWTSFGIEEPLEGVKAIDWSPDGQAIMISTRRGTSIHNLSTLTHNSDLEGSLSAYSRDGLTLATIDGEWVRIYSSTGLMTGSVRTHSPPDCLTWGDAEHAGCLAVGTRSGRILLIDAATAKIVGNASAMGSAPTPVVSVSWRGSILASASSGSSASQDQVVRLWMVDAGRGSLEQMRVLRGWGGDVRTALWCPEGHDIAVAYGRGGPIRVFGADGDEKLRIDPGWSGDLKGAIISPDGRMIAALTERGEVTIWDSRFGVLATRLDVAPISCIAWHPERIGVVALGGENGVVVVDVSHPEADVLGRIDPKTSVGCVAWSGEGDLLAVGLASRVEVWDMSRPVLVASREAWRYPRCAAWSPDGSMLAYLSGFDESVDAGHGPGCPAWDISKVVVWRVGARNEASLELVLLGMDLVPRGGDVSVQWALSWAPNSSVLAASTGTSDFYMPSSLEICNLPAKPCVVVWAVQGGGLVRLPTLVGLARWGTSVSWSADGSMLAGGSSDGVVFIWRVGSPQPVPEGGALIQICSVTTLILFFFRRHVLLSVQRPWPASGPIRSCLLPSCLAEEHICDPLAPARMDMAEGDTIDGRMTTGEAGEE